MDEIKDKLLEALDAAKAKDPKAYHVTNVVSYADWVVIASATSGPHIKSVVRKAEEALLKAGVKSQGIEGMNTASDWVLLDFGDIVLHVMSEEKRDFYQLEKIFVE